LNLLLCLLFYFTCEITLRAHYLQKQKVIFIVSYVTLKFIMNFIILKTCIYLLMSFYSVNIICFFPEFLLGSRQGH
jgi:hypothetical protein